MRSKKLLALVSLVVILAVLFAACGGAAQNSEPAKTETAVKEEPKKEAVKEEPKKETPKKKFKVALSNGYIGNGWRTQMVQDFEKLATYYKGQGIIEDYTVQSAGVDVNNQIAQIRNMINKGYDLIVIDANSPTALNPVIEEASKKGITVVAADSPVTSPFATKVLVDQKVWGATLAEWFAKELGGKGNVLIVSGLAGHPANVDRVNGQKEVLAKYPDIKILGEINGNWDQAAAQQVMSNALASYPKLDGVITQDGMALGVVKAFVAAKRPIPVVSGELMVGYLKLWKELKDKQNFKSFGLNNPPGMICNGLGIGIRLLQGKEFKEPLKDKTYLYSIKDKITNDNLDAYLESVSGREDTYFPDEYMTEAELDGLFK